jgi:DUF1680 family protein
MLNEEIMHKERPQKLKATLVRGLSNTQPVNLDYPIQPISVTKSKITGGFWFKRLEDNRNNTLPIGWKNLKHCILDLEIAGNRIEKPQDGLHWRDSDLFKVMEGAALALAHKRDPELEKTLDHLIELTAGAQEPDGYLYTARTCDPTNPPSGAGPTRWSFLPGSHEMYCMGHMIEAAVSHYEVTGKRTFLNVALLCGNLLVNTFGKDKLRDVDGHQEIEMALARLYRVSGDSRYLDLCRFFLDERGHHDVRKSYRDAEQDHLPVLQQKEPVGHAVRAGYMYAAMADIAAMQDDARYAIASEHLWKEVTYKRYSISGGIGPLHEGEAYAEPYNLPNGDIHNETCAAIAHMLWSHRLYLLTGDGKYMDIFERGLYNCYLASTGIDGLGFLYCNPQETRFDKNFTPGRPEYQGCACCPTNVSRITPAVPGFVYSTKGGAIQVLLYVTGHGTITTENGVTVKLSTESNYPWDGHIKITVETDKPSGWGFDIQLRIPCWVQGFPVPGDLYRYADESHIEPFTVKVNGAVQNKKAERGFANIGGSWEPGKKHTIELDLPMPIRRVLPHDKIDSCSGRVTLERGPLVYCLEGIDHANLVTNLVIPDDATFTAEHCDDLLSGITLLKGTGLARYKNAKGENISLSRAITAVPYFAWGNRGVGEMAIWIARTEAVANEGPHATLAARSNTSASTIFSYPPWHATPFYALNDQIDPAKDDKRKFSWADHKGTKEWVQYDFDGEQTVSSVDVFWSGGTVGEVHSLALPMSWKLLYRKGKKWIEVEKPSSYPVKLGKFVKTTFTPVTTTGLRIEAQLAKDTSAGILEWAVE